MHNDSSQASRRAQVSLFACRTSQLIRPTRALVEDPQLIFKDWYVFEMTCEAVGLAFGVAWFVVIPIYQMIAIQGLPISGAIGVYAILCLILHCEMKENVTRPSALPERSFLSCVKHSLTIDRETSCCICSLCIVGDCHVTPCLHLYHKACLDMCEVCPQCRTPLVVS